MINTIKATINLTNVCLDEVDLGNGVIYRGDDLATSLEIKAPINSNAYVLLACITPNGRNLGPFNADNTISTSTATTYEFLLTKENGYNFAVGRTELIIYYCVVNTNSSISKKAIGSICVDVKKGVSVDDEATFIIGDTTDADAVLTDLNTKMDNLINQVASFSAQLSNKLDAVKNTVTLTNSGLLFTSRVESGNDYTVQSQGRNGISSIVDSSTADNNDNRTATTTTLTITDKTSSKSTEVKQTANYVTLKATDGTNTKTLAISPQSININGEDVVVEEDLTAERTARQGADNTLQTNIDNEALARQSADNTLQSQIDAINSRADVVDVVANYAALQSYDTTTLTDDDIIKVLNDETQNNSQTYYKWNGALINTFTLIGSIGASYTKAETDAKDLAIIDSSKNYTDNIYTLATNNIAGKDTSTNILEKSSNSGIWVGTDTGHWYYWNGTQYADGGVYQATEIADGSVTISKIENGLIDVLELLDGNDNQFKLNINNDYVVGSIDTSGVDNTLYNRVKIMNFLPYNITIKPNGLKVFARYYNSNFEFIGYDTYLTDTNVSKTHSGNPNIKYIRYALAKTDDTVFTPSDYVAEVYLNCTNLVDNELTEKEMTRSYINPANGGFQYEIAVTPYFKGTFSTKYFIKVKDYLKFTYDYQLTIIEYKSDLTPNGYISNVSSGTYSLKSDTTYVKLRYRTNSELDKSFLLQHKLYTNGKQVKAPYTTDTNILAFTFGTGNSMSSGHIKLPSNYNPNGKKTPVVLFVHGSGDYQAMSQATTWGTYNDYLNYIRDNGYAIIDFYGLDFNHPQMSNTWGNPTTLRTYLDGLRYVLDVYNLDENNVFISGKSLGGIVGYLLPFYTKIKGVGLLAPSLDAIQQGCGYNENEKDMFAKDFGFIEDEENPFKTATGELYRQYITDNYGKLSGYIPYWCNRNDTKESKLTKSFYAFTQYDLTEISQYYKSKLKIWVAEDDININPLVCHNVIDMVNNGGNIATIRIMPNNTGGHHAVDNDTNALQQTNVTTSLGVNYETIPLAYYELVEFFNNI